MFLNKWVLVNQRSDWCFFTVNTGYVQSESQTMLFQVWEKLYIQSKVIEVCEFRTKIPAFYSHLQFAALCLADIQQKRFFGKKVKNISEIGIVSCISLPMKRTVESQLNNSRRGKTERKWFKRKRQKFKLLFLLRRNVAFVLLLANAVTK